MRCAWSFAAFIAAIGLYGAVGSPVPAALRWQEMLIGLGVAAFALVGWMEWRSLGLAVPRSGTMAVLAFAWAALIGSGRGLWLGWEIEDIARDLIGLAFLALPLVLYPALVRLRADQKRMAADALAIAGACLVARWAWQVRGSFPALAHGALGEGQDYLLNSALVPFAAVWAGLRCGGLLLGLHPAVLRCMLALPWAICCGACLLALAATVHRASLGFALLGLMGGLAPSLRDRRAVPWLLLSGVLVLGLGGDALGHFIGLAAEKTQAVGGNNRVEEALAALAEISADPAAWWFGRGWGALFANPAVGFWHVSYAHNAAIYAFLKLGACGLALGAVYVGMAAAWIAPARHQAPALFWSACPALLVGFMLHTSYKYMCFGLIAALVASGHKIILERKERS
jgi:hypothetical protein